jgi:hypothetical protein
MRMYGCVRLSLLPREELLNGGSGGRPRPITQRSGPHRLRRIQGMSHDREPKNLSDVARAVALFAAILTYIGWDIFTT